MTPTAFRPATRDEIAAMARTAGLDLAPEHLDELVDAYGHLEPMLMRLRRGRDRSEEPAHVFDPRRFSPTGSEA